MMALFQNSKARAWFYQALLLCLVLTVGYLALSNAFENLNQQGVATGFGFLDDRAGFGISQSMIAYDESDSYGRTFFVGLANTLMVSFLGIVAATLLGFLLGVARLSPNWLLARLAALYVEIFRNVPLLLQLIFWYVVVLQSLPSPRQSYQWFNSVFLNVRGLYFPSYTLEAPAWVYVITCVMVIVVISLWVRHCLRYKRHTGRYKPMISVSLLLTMMVAVLFFNVLGGDIQWSIPGLKGFNFTGGWILLPELLALWFALTIYTAAFIAEVVRSGIQSVDQGQLDAAKALGLTQRQTLKLVTIPQALRVIIPPLTNQYLNLMKNSSLATAIGYPDLVAVFAGTTLNQTGQAIEVITMTMLVYLLISLSVSLLMNWFNRRVMVVER